MQTPGAVGQDPGTPQKGPRVWLDMDQAELDAAYTQSVWAPNHEQLVARHRSNSAIARTHLGAPQRYAYGATPIEALDVYRTTRPGAPIHIFSMVGRGAGAWPSTTPLPPSCSSTPGPISWCRTSPGCRTWVAVSCRWPRRCAAPSPGSMVTPSVSAVTRSASMSPATPQAAISPACSSPPTGARRLTSRRISSRGAVL